jgi:NitT/TauT family transport system substrate-binding protein
LGDNALRLPSSDIYKETFNFLVMNDYARNSPEVLVKFLRAIDKATRLIKVQEKSEQECHEIVAKRLGLDRAVMTVLWKDFVFELSLEHALIITLEDEARWAVKNKLVEAEDIPNYLDYVYVDALEKVRPGAIGIIR